MPGEFTLYCDTCPREMVVLSVPRCPRCQDVVALCASCMPKHDCVLRSQTSATPTRKAKLVTHHADPPCSVRLETNGDCATCGVHHNMQSLALWAYCPDCNVPLKKMTCPSCATVYVMP